ncbi:hypothetical protein STEG23_010424, partial [Scotinomys teguina]
IDDGTRPPSPGMYTTQDSSLFTCNDLCIYLLQAYIMPSNTMMANLQEGEYREPDISNVYGTLIIIVRETPISGVRTFYTDANKQGKAGYKSEDLSKVVQSPYNSVQKSELYAILLVLMDFSEPLNIVTDSQYAERVVLHIETAEFIPDESELTSLFIQLQDIIRNRKHPLYITHIRSHTGLPGPLAQGNDEIDKLLIGNVLEASEFHKKHHVNSKGLKRDFSITWQQAKEIVRKCPTCSFYNQTPLPAGCNPKGTQRNDIWQMDVFHFAEFGKLKYVHHTIDTYSGFQWATALSSEKADSVITHLLEVMAIMGIPAQIKTDNAPAYVSGSGFGIVKFIYMVYYIDRLLYVEPSLHLCDKAYLVMVDNVFDVFLESVCQYFIEYFSICVHEGDWNLSISSRFSNFVEYRFLKYDLMILWISSLSVVISPISFLFINLDALSLYFEKVPWGAEKKQKDGPCFHIRSVNLCIFIVGKIFFNAFVEYGFCAFELVFFSFFYPYYLKVRHFHGVPDFLDILHYNLFGFGVFLDC